MTSFERGFIKCAKQYGIEEEKVVAFLKTSEEDWREQLLKMLAQTTPAASTNAPLTSVTNAVPAVAESMFKSAPPASTNTNLLSLIAAGKQ